MNAAMIELRVRGVAVGRDGSDPVLVLEDPVSGGKLAVPAGPSEAGAILLEIEGLSPAKPGPHDVLASMFRDHGFKLERIELREDGMGPDGARFRAKLVYRGGMRRWRRDARPADAIALALKLGAPVAAPAGIADRCPWPAAKTRGGNLYYLERRDAERGRAAV